MPWAIWTKKGETVQKITPFLWFDENAEEAVNFYVSLFKNAKIGDIARYGEATAEVSGRPAGSVMTIAFELVGQQFVALNGGPHFKFSPAVSFAVGCDTQEEIDHLWEKLSEGGEIMECGWLTDRFGVTWQIVPSVLDELLGQDDPEKSERVMEALLKMTKLDIETLRQAADKA